MAITKRSRISRSRSRKTSRRYRRTNYKKSRKSLKGGTRKRRSRRNKRGGSTNEGVCCSKVGEGAWEPAIGPPKVLGGEGVPWGKTPCDAFKGAGSGPGGKNYKWCVNGECDTCDEEKTVIQTKEGRIQREYKAEEAAAAAEAAAPADEEVVAADEAKDDE